MKRTLYLNSRSNLLVQQLANHPELIVITPTLQAARGRKVPSQSLEAIALQIPLRVAPVLSHRILRTTVNEVIETSDTEGTTRALTPALKAILRAGIDLDKLETVSSIRTQQLARLARVYTAKLREGGLVDPSEVLWQATSLQPQRQSVLIYGYFHPRIDELAFLNAIAGDGSMMLLPCSDSAIFIDNHEAVGWLQQQGWQVEAAVVPATTGEQLQACFLNGTDVPNGVQSYIYPHLEAEVRGVLSQVKSLLVAGVAANEIVLVARDDAFYGPAVTDVAWEYNLPVIALYAVPLITTRVGSWVQLLLEVIQEKFPFESTVKLLSYPLCSGLPAEVWLEARKLHPSGIWAWQSLGVNLSLLDWPQQDTRAEWVQRLQDVLNKFDLRCSAERWAREIVAFYKLQEGLIDLAKPEAESISLQDFAQDVIDSLVLLSVPAQPGRGGVELYTPMTLFGAEFKHVFVLGAAEGILPAPVQDDPVLDFHERKQLLSQGFQFEGAAQAARREAISFYALLQTATTTITFSYPQLIGSKASLKSPYLARLRLEPTPPPPGCVASVEEARRIYLRRDGAPNDPVLPHAFHAWTVENRREGAALPDEYNGVVGLPLDPATRVFSASQLTALGQCPFKWFVDKVLRLAELEEAENRCSPLLKGNLYHRCLELALTKVLGAADLSQVGMEQLKSAFWQAEQDLGFPNLPAWNAQRSEHIKTLSRTIQQPDFLQPGAEIIALESEFEGELYGLKVRGRMDRVDRTPEGLVLWDYKTGSSKPIGIKDDSGKANLDIQLPLYIHVAATLFPGEIVDAAYYYSLSKGKLFNAKSSEETLSAIAQRVKTHLETGHYPVDPDVEQKVCRSCSYDMVCRNGSRNRGMR